MAISFTLSLPVPLAVSLTPNLPSPCQLVCFLPPAPPTAPLHRTFNPLEIDIKSTPFSRASPQFEGDYPPTFKSPIYKWLFSKILRLPYSPENSLQNHWLKFLKNGLFTPKFDIFPPNCSRRNGIIPRDVNWTGPGRLVFPSQYAILAIFRRPSSLFFRRILDLFSPIF